MITIYKYIIDPISSGIEMPIEAEIIKAEAQGNDFCIWAKVNTLAEIETRNFVAFATGEIIPQQMGTDHLYIGTGFFDNGLVFHAFERTGL